jgi:hypothetical protein
LVVIARIPFAKAAWIAARTTPLNLLVWACLQLLCGESRFHKWLREAHFAALQRKTIETPL